MREPFERVVARHGPTVLRVCLAVLRRADAEDAWSETFLSALRAYPDLPEDANVEAWLVTIARRKSIDVVRRSARTTPVEALPDRVVEDALPDLDLWDAVGALPHKQRHAVVYHHLAGLPYDEVAALIGGTPAAARRAGADGIAALRRTYPASQEES
jgi:RNA polymerase sigma factor (sigma-70 family)